ncbi:MAG: helix-turn-helix domain-containing protein [Lachnospiraceae bacterium]|nr:helix-turn-helix domain-containing protein [Lachnospiraceae bacterium]
MKKGSLGLKLLELRQLHNLTQKQLCEALNIGRSTYSYFETGNRMPDVETLILIAQYYKVSLDELIGYSDSISENTKTDADDSCSDIQILHYLKSKNVSKEFILKLSKADFDFLKDYKQLTDDNKAELQYLVNYKLRKQTK